MVWYDHALSSHMMDDELCALLAKLQSRWKLPDDGCHLVNVCDGRVVS